MPRITIPIPSSQVASTIDALWVMYGMKAEAIHSEVEAQLNQPYEQAHRLRRHREELRAIEDAIDQLGWTKERLRTAAMLTTEQALVVEVLHRVLAVAVDRLDLACHDMRLTDPDLDPIDGALHQTNRARDSSAKP